MLQRCHAPNTLIIKSLRLQAIFFICSWLNSYLLSYFSFSIIDSDSKTSYCLNSVQFIFYILKSALKELCISSVSSIIIENWIISRFNSKYLFSFIYQLIISAANWSVVKNRLRVKIYCLFIVTPKGDHQLSQRYSELYLNTLSKPLHWLSKKCRRQDLNSQPQQPLPDLIPLLMLQTARFYARLYYHMQTWAHNLLHQKVITYWVSAIVSYILTFIIFLVKVDMSDVFINLNWFLLSQLINISEFFACEILEFHHEWCVFKSSHSKVLCVAFI